MPREPKDEPSSEQTGSGPQEPVVSRIRSGTLRREDLRAAKGLPPLPPEPVIPATPGPERWSAMIELAHTRLSKAAKETQTYHDERSQEWQERAKAEEIIATLKALQESISQLQEGD
jgi:hypothetical protein